MFFLQAAAAMVYVIRIVPVEVTEMRQHHFCPNQKHELSCSIKLGSSGLNIRRFQAVEAECVQKFRITTLILHALPQV
jgi:hypothetical protein